MEYCERYLKNVNKKHVSLDIREKAGAENFHKVGVRPSLGDRQRHPGLWTS
jgi:hypothetical protein